MLSWRESEVEITPRDGVQKAFWWMFPLPVFSNIIFKRHLVLDMNMTDNGKTTTLSESYATWLSGLTVKYVPFHRFNNNKNMTLFGGILLLYSLLSHGVCSFYWSLSRSVSFLFINSTNTAKINKAIYIKLCDHSRQASQMSLNVFMLFWANQYQKQNRVVFTSPLILNIFSLYSINIVKCFIRIQHSVEKSP